MATFLAFDVGGKRIGVAVGNTITGSATAIGVLKMLDEGPDWPQLERWMREWRPDGLVVGDPMSLDGFDSGDQTSRKRARRFAEETSQRFSKRCVMVDERHSSQEAAQRFAQQRAEGERRRKHADELDALAAVIILERFLSSAQARQFLEPDTQSTAHDD